VPASTVFGDSVPLQLQVTGGDGKSVISNTVTIAIEPVLQ
jgi:hypothetical protein